METADGAAPRSEPIVVRPGDTLWRLAAVRLPARAHDAQVAALVAALHRRNRSVIGPDADVIRPGQRLVLPRQAAPVRPDLPRRPRDTDPEETP